MTEWFVSLISGGIDSSVAADIIARKGYNILFLHMDNRPFSDENVPDKVFRLAKIIKNRNGINATVITVPHGKMAQVAIADGCDGHYQCVMCRRAMLMTAELICDIYNARAIITGESLGQVASQTLDNMMAESYGIKTPIIRPLISWDKMDIVREAKAIGTYEISIERGVCCLLAPQKPKIRSSVERVLKESRKIDLGAIVKRMVEARHEHEL